MNDRPVLPEEDRVGAAREALVDALRYDREVSAVEANNLIDRYEAALHAAPLCTAMVGGPNGGTPLIRCNRPEHDKVHAVGQERANVHTFVRAEGVDQGVRGQTCRVCGMPIRQVPTDGEWVHRLVPPGHAPRAEGVDRGVRPQQDEILRKYGDHLAGCDILEGAGYNPANRHCTCGFEQALAESAPVAPPREDFHLGGESEMSGGQLSKLETAAPVAVVTHSHSDSCSGIDQGHLDWFNAQSVAAVREEDEAAGLITALDAAATTAEAREVVLDELGRTQERAVAAEARLADLHGQVAFAQADIEHLKADYDKNVREIAELRAELDRLRDAADEWFEAREAWLPDTNAGARDEAALTDRYERAKDALADAYRAAALEGQGRGE
jgi:regulator of replication initiation timing